MKLFQQLMLAPAALGLVAPFAAQANGYDMASSTSAINTYTQQQDLDRFRAWEAQNQVTSINQFADVKPTDWAYQALSNLIERYGCVAGYPNGTFKGAQAMTRFEAAALLNACLDRVTETTDELQRLINEFQKELTVLKGRVDGLDKRVGKLEATQFSTTTKLRGDSRWVLGGQSFAGTASPGNNRGYTAGTVNNTRYNNASNNNVALRNAVSFNYDVRLNFDTSFTGKDLLRTQLRSGNFSDSAFGASPTRQSNLDAGFQENCGTGADCGDVVAINRLYYRFPIGKEFTAIVGPRMRQDEYFAVWPSAYTGDRILKLFQFAGAPVANSQVLGAGGGIYWKQAKRDKNDKSAKWSLSAGYLAQNGDGGTPGQEFGTDCTSTISASTDTAEGGIGNECSVGQGSVQLALTGTNWNISALYTYNQTGVSINGTQTAIQAVSEAAGTNAFGLAGYWQPIKTGWVPSISAGWGIANSNALGQGAAAGNSYTVRGTNGVTINRGTSITTQSWMVGLNWKDAFQKGNVAGMAVGQSPFVTGNNKGYANQDGNYAWEWFYKFQVTDNIAITPALFYLSRPQGEQTGTRNFFNSTGYLIQTTFRF
jgi:hypothetical protein